MVCGIIVLHTIPTIDPGVTVSENLIRVTFALGHPKVMKPVKYGGTISVFELLTQQLGEQRGGVPSFNSNSNSMASVHELLLLTIFIVSPNG